MKPAQPEPRRSKQKHARAKPDQVRPATVPSDGAGEFPPEDDGAPNLIDRHVGARLRLRRGQLGLSQVAIGEALGIVHQQIHKYERGASRLGASRLFEMARVLDVPVGYFFEGMSREVGSHLLWIGAKDARLSEDDEEAVLRREMMELVRHFTRIDDEAVRRKVLELLRTLGPPE